MAVRRVLIWTCDYCGADAERTGYGFPPGWGHGFRLTGGPPIHYCEPCGAAHGLADGRTIPEVELPPETA